MEYSFLIGAVHCPPKVIHYEVSKKYIWIKGGSNEQINV